MPSDSNSDTSDEEKELYLTREKNPNQKKLNTTMQKKEISMDQGDQNKPKKILKNNNVKYSFRPMIVKNLGAKRLNIATEILQKVPYYPLQV